MSDEVDRANQEVEYNLAEALRKNRSPYFTQGSSGDCDYCGEWSARLVGGACAPCRDRYKLP